MPIKMILDLLIDKEYRHQCGIVNSGASGVIRDPHVELRSPQDENSAEFSVVGKRKIKKRCVIFTQRFAKS